MNKNLIFLLIGLFSIVFISCEKDIEPLENNLDYTALSNTITVKNGYLHFSNKEVLDDYIKQVKDALESKSSGVKSSSVIPTFKGFNSLAQSIANSQVDNFKKTKSIQELDNALSPELNELLIPDEAIHHVVDDQNRVQIAEELYQITEVGTFIYKEKNITDFEGLYENFSKESLSKSNQVDESVFDFGKVKFVDSFGYGKLGDFNREAIISEMISEISDEFIGITKSKPYTYKPYVKTPYDGTAINSAYTNKYNLTTYRAGAKTLVGKGFQSLFGENSYRKKKLDSDHRLKFKLYSVDYFFYKNSGARLKFQKRKRVTKRIRIFGWKKTITLYTYWSTRQVPEMVVGVDYFKGHYLYEDFGMGNKYQSDTKMDFSETFSKSVVSMGYKGLIKAPSDFFRGWVTNLECFKYTISVPFSNNVQTDKLLGKAFDQGMKAVKNYTIKSGSGYVYNKIKDAPRLLLNDQRDYNKEYVSFKGVHTYRNRSSIHVKFGHSSGGAKLQSMNGKLSGGGYTPNAFFVDEAYIFGAVKYDGKWKGIRMYIR